jgi:hypothetical protein
MGNAQIDIEPRPRAVIFQEGAPLDVLMSETTTHIHRKYLFLRNLSSEDSVRFRAVSGLGRFLGQGNRIRCRRVRRAPPIGFG